MKPSTSANSDGSAADLETRRRAELRAFLRARRGAIAPETAGLPRGKRRLTPGLRREEVASLAGVGLTWYTWLEQGRRINVSAPTLRRVAMALQLTDTDEHYLFTLAGLSAPRASARFDRRDLSTLQRVLDGFTTGPAVMFGPSFDALAYNRLWELIYVPDGHRGRFAKNHVYRLFMDPARRALYVDYDLVARHMVGLLRAQYADHVGFRDFEDLVGILRADSPEFERLWGEHETQPLAPFTLRLNTASLGRLTLDVSRFPVEGAPGVVIFFGPPADQQTAALLAKAGRALT